MGNAHTVAMQLIEPLYALLVSVQNLKAQSPRLLFNAPLARVLVIFFFLPEDMTLSKSK